MTREAVFALVPAASATSVSFTGRPFTRTPPARPEQRGGRGRRKGAGTPGSPSFRCRVRATARS